jgi:hypothetical protein
MPEKGKLVIVNLKVRTNQSSALDYLFIGLAVLATAVLFAVWQ